MEQHLKDKLIAAIQSLMGEFEFEMVNKEVIDKMTMKLEVRIKEILEENGRTPTEEDFPIEFELVNVGAFVLPSHKSILEFHPSPEIADLGIEKRIN